MEDNVQKILFMAAGVLLVLMGLRSFFRHEINFHQYYNEYKAKEVKALKPSWLQESPSKTTSYPGKFVLSSHSSGGIVANGEEIKTLLQGILMDRTNVSVGKTVYEGYDKNDDLEIKIGSKTAGVSTLESLVETIDDIKYYKMTWISETKLQIEEEKRG